MSRIDPAEGPDPDPTDPDPTDPDPTDPDPTDPTDPTGDACTATINIVSDWGSGWQGNVTVTAVEGLDNWSLQWTWPGDQAITSHWNADLNTTGTSVTATDVGWNGTIAAGQSLEVFGFIATGAGSAPQITCTTA
ncbi:cellulose binding domain-containing protein [Glycomyces sp. NRRL B-16210]|uniref:cellulose binding domain-containing protein n=1 Tax=Glycomyces sp. NRRL B-16210 TaxID=1463821 RepID=UPI00350FF642